MANPNKNDVVAGTLAKILYSTNADSETTAGVEAFFQACQESYVIQDQYITIAMLTVNGVCYGVGASKRSAADKQNPFRGKALALSRAVRHAFAWYTEHDNLRPKAE